MTGLYDPTALRAANGLLVKTTLGCLLVAVVCVALSRGQGTFAVPGALAFLFGHLTGGLAILTWARAKYLTDRPRAGGMDFLVLAMFHFSGGMMAMIGLLATLLVAAGLIMTA